MSEWVSEWQGKTVIRKSPMKKGQCCRRFLYLWRRRRKFIFFVSFFVRVRQEYLNFCRLWQYPSCVKLTQPEENWIFVVLCFDVGIVQREAHGENLIKKFGKNTQLSSTIPELEVNFRNSLSRHFVLLVLAIRSNYWLARRALNAQDLRPLSERVPWTCLPYLSRCLGTSCTHSNEDPVVTIGCFLIKFCTQY